MSDRAALIAAVRTAIDDTHAEYAQMPFFIRPMVRRGFAKRTGHDLDGWRRLLDDAARGTVSPGLAGALAQLAAHYDGAPERAKKGMAKAEELVEIERRSKARADAARALAAHVSAAPR